MSYTDSLNLSVISSMFSIGIYNLPSNINDFGYSEKSIIMLSFPLSKIGYPA